MPPDTQQATLLPSPEDEKIPTICLIGAAGTGKSSTGNILFKHACNSVFATSGRMSSVTFVEPQCETRPWRGQQGMVRCVDTPGLGDTKGRDVQNVGGVMEVLRNRVTNVHVFLAFFNAEEPKLNFHLKEMLLTFKDSLGQDFLLNTMVCFTHWKYDRKAMLKRKKHGGTAQQMSSRINETLRSTLGHDYDVPCIFLDNTLNMCSDEELHEIYEGELPAVLHEFESELEKVYKFALKAKPFRFADRLNNPHRVVADQAGKRCILERCCMCPRRSR